MAVKSVIEAVREAIREEMARDPKVFVMGEDRAVSVLANVKPEVHPKTCVVEPGGVKGKKQHLAWGDLLRENGGEVSRGRSSEEGG